MRRELSLAAGLALACAMLAAAPARAQDDFENEDKCWDANELYSPDQQITACSKLLRSRKVSEDDRPYLVAMRGWSYHEQGDFAHALEDYSEKIRLQPEVADGYGWRASVYYDQEDYTHAVADYSEAIRLGADSADLGVWYHDRGLARHYLGESDGGIEDLTRSIEVDDSDPMSWADRGYVYHEMKEYARAVADYTKVINLAPDEAGNWNSRCWTRAVWGQQLVEALDDCNEAIALDPQDFNSYDSRALVRLRREEWDDARDDYQASLDAMPSASAHFGLGIALKRLGLDADAEREFAAAALLDPMIAETYAGFGIVP